MWQLFTPTQKRRAKKKYTSTHHPKHHHRKQNRASYGIIMYMDDYVQWFARCVCLCAEPHTGNTNSNIVFGRTMPVFMLAKSIYPHTQNTCTLHTHTVTHTMRIMYYVQQYIFTHKCVCVCVPFTVHINRVAQMGSCVCVSFRGARAFTMPCARSMMMTTTCDAAHSRFMYVCVSLCLFMYNNRTV